MSDILAKKSNILVLKSKFFLIRLVSYFSFLLAPILIPKSLHLDQSIKVLMITLYVLFICGQWFFLGKEIDYRLKIYFRINSSIDRVVYRLFLGKIFFILYFYLISFLPSKWIYNAFWITWVLLGLFYSWPTRGKIIQESVSTNFHEFRYLDRFEKTLVGLIIVMFIFSIPEFPRIGSAENLRSFFDPQSTMNTSLWSFLKVNYYPFYKYPNLFRMAWSMHFYIVNIGFFLLTFYTFLKFFFARRLSLLGVFSLLSAWSFSEILSVNYGSSYQATYSLLWIWTFVWVIKSSTYRTGLFLGLVGFYGALINQSWALLLPIQVTLVYFFFLKKTTFWFRRQMLKYTLWGGVSCLFVGMAHFDHFWQGTALTWGYFGEVEYIFRRKAFFFSALFGIGLMVIRCFLPRQKFAKFLGPGLDSLGHLLIAIFFLFVYALCIDASLVRSISLMWMIAFLSLVPLEFIFQRVGLNYSRRNIIYVLYILICLLDSHFEERIKIFLKILKF